MRGQDSAAGGGGYIRTFALEQHKVFRHKRTIFSLPREHKQISLFLRRTWQLFLLTASLRCNEVSELFHSWDTVGRRASAGHVRAVTCPLEHQLTERRAATFVKGRINVSYRGPSSQQQRTCTVDDGSSRTFLSIKCCSRLIKSIAALRSFQSCLFLIAGGPNAV